MNSLLGFPSKSKLIPTPGIIFEVISYTVGFRVGIRMTCHKVVFAAT